MKVAGIQLDPRLGEVDENRDAIVREGEAAADAGARLLVFPECANTGYCFQSKEQALEVAEPAPGHTVEAVAALCTERGVTAVVGLLLREGDDLANVAAVVTPDGLAGMYRKSHLPTLGVDRFATPGADPFTVYDTPAGRLGPAICYDARFPEPSRVLALEGAQIIVLPTNWPEGSEKVPEFVVRTRAMENCVFFVAVNRCGTEAGFRFVGRSTIAGPDGAVLAQANPDHPEIIYANIDPARADEKDVIVRPGAHEFHFWRDRRPTLYQRITDVSGETEEDVLSL